MKLLTGDDSIPRRKRKPKATPFDHYEPFLKLKSMLLNNKLEVGQQVGLLFDRHDVEKLKMKWPWRTATDRLRRLLRETGLSDQYTIVKYETDTAGVWFVRVTRNEPKLAGLSRNSKRA